MKPPSVDVLRSLSRLETNIDFQRIVAWIRESHSANIEGLSDVSGHPQAEWLQGRTQELKELLKHIETAHETLKARIEEEELGKFQKTF